MTYICVMDISIALIYILARPPISRVHESWPKLAGIAIQNICPHVDRLQGQWMNYYHTEHLPSC